MREMTVEQATDMMLHVCDAIIGQKQYLAEVDSRIGDGDHGAGMAGGMEKAKAALEAKRPFPDINTIFRTMGMEMIGSMGGASGVIFGSMFMGGARDVPSAQILDSDILAKMMRASLDAVKHRGKAQLGDKTMVDALEPAVLALERQACAELEESLKSLRTKKVWKKQKTMWRNLEERNSWEKERWDMRTPGLSLYGLFFRQ